MPNPIKTNLIKRENEIRKRSSTVGQCLVNLRIKADQSKEDAVGNAIGAEVI